MVSSMNPILCVIVTVQALMLFIVSAEIWACAIGWICRRNGWSGRAFNVLVALVAIVGMIGIASVGFTIMMHLPG